MLTPLLEVQNMGEERSLGETIINCDAKTVAD